MQNKQAMITRFPSPLKENLPGLNDEQKITLIAEHFSEIMNILGLDLDDSSLARTPRRVAKMFVHEIFSGLYEENFPSISFVKNRYQADGDSNIVFTKVRFTSFCEHHFVPMMGSAYIAYLPKEKLIGLSKIPRIVRFFSRRPQIQERLTAQVADCLATLLETEDVAVSMTAQHFCVTARGIEDQSGTTTTNVLRGQFSNNDRRRQEFFEAITKG